MMFSHQILKPFFLLTVAIILLLQTNNCFCKSHFNASLATSGSGVATFYTDASGTDAGTGGGCSIPDNFLPNAPYFGLTAAGNQNLYASGKECGACYAVKCTSNPMCSGFSTTVTITNECPGSCNDDPIHFDLSIKAFKFLAKQGQGDAFLKLGRVAIEYQRVPCFYKNTNIGFQVVPGANQFYLSFSVENVNGDGDLGSVEVKPAKSGSWISMTRVIGTRYFANVNPQGLGGPYSVRLTSIESKKQVVAQNVIPAGYVPGKFYQSNVNF